ncbi:MAG: hypothetical protein MUE85_03445 [Microscillaceae bacterium]|jgi:hypothetical protein|nr:hypothetical protein [Microscillaceae bacterium]
MQEDNRNGQNNSSNPEQSDPILLWIANTIEEYDDWKYDSEGISIFLKGELIAKYYYEDLAQVIYGNLYDEE